MAEKKFDEFCNSKKGVALGLTGDREKSIYYKIKNPDWRDHNTSEKALRKANRSYKLMTNGSEMDPHKRKRG